MGFAQPGSATMLMAKRAATVVASIDDVFFRHMVGNMRNGVLAIDRDGGLVLLNDEARRLFHLPAGPVDRPPYADVLHEHPDIVRVLGGAFELQGAAQPRRAAPQVHRHRDRLHAVAGPRRRGRDGRRGAVLQGPHARRADRRARAAARSPRRGRRNGRGDGARDQEPARRHRGAGRTAAPQGARQRRRAGARQGHHQRSQDGQRDRAGSAGVRAAGAPAGRSHVARRRDRAARSSLADGKATRGSILVDVDAAAATCRRSAPINTSSRRCSATC